MRRVDLDRIRAGLDRGPASSPSSASSSSLTIGGVGFDFEHRVREFLRPGTSMSAKPVSTSDRRFLPSVCWS